MYHKWKRAVAGMLSACLVTTFVPQVSEIGKYIQTSEALQVVAKSKVTSGKCGKNATWKYDTKTKTLTIGGRGAMEDYNDPYEDYEKPSDCKNPPWKNVGKVEKIVIGDGITKIGSCSFVSLKVKEVKLGKNIKKIGSGAFAYCQLLKKITIGDKVEKIGSCAFFECDLLKEVKFGKNIKEIGVYAFFECGELKKIKLGDKVKEIGSSAFDGCSSLKEVKLGENVEKIGKFAFGWCINLKKINLGDNLKEIGTQAFFACNKITSIYMGKSLKSIGKEVVNGCDNLKKIKIHPKNKNFVLEDNLLLDKKKTTIYLGTFVQNTTCYIDATVKKIDLSVVDGTRLEHFEVNSKNKKFYSEAGLLYSKDGKKLYICPRGMKGTVVISEKAEQINRDEDEDTAVFKVNPIEDCEKIKKIIVGKNVKYIPGFYGCTRLKEVEVDAENEYYASEKGCILSKDRKRLIGVIGADENGTVTVPEDVTKIDYGAFYTYIEGLQHIILSDGVEEFHRLPISGTKSITFGKNYYNGGDISWLVKEENEELMFLSAVNVSKENPYYSSVDGILYNKEQTKILISPPAATICNMPDTVTSVGENAFVYTSLKELSISDGLKDMTEIAKQFSWSEMSKLHIGKSVENISRIYSEKLKTLTVSSENQHYKAVKNILYTKDGNKLVWCPQGKTGTITIPNGTTTIGKGAFKKDKKITKIIIPKSITKIEKNAFYGVNKKVVFVVPKGKKAFYKKLLTSKTGFKSTMTIKEAK